MNTAAPRRHPLLWVPTSYFAMGTTYMTITFVTTIMFKNLGMPDRDAAFWASALGFPYTVKFLWAPLLEMFKTKKFFVVSAQLAMGCLFGGIALALKLPAFVSITLVLLLVAAVAGATQDIASDGVYVTSLSAGDQAKFTGFQNLCWSLGPIFASGVLVRFSGEFHEGGMSWASSWQAICALIAGTLIALGLYHRAVLPTGAKAHDAPTTMAEGASTMVKAFSSLFQKRGIWMMLSFAYLYRFGQGLLDKIGPLFLMKARDDGGLGLSNQVLGDINGVYGMVGFVAGALLGGWLVKRTGLNRRVLFTLCCLMNVPNATYIYLGMTQPEDLWFIGTVVTLEKFGFGFGAVAHMIYMMQQLAPGDYKTTHYAFGTALMGFCMMTTGMVSGYLQQAMGGYVEYFWFVMAATIPSFLVTWFAPFHVDVSAEKEPAAAP